MIDAGQLNFAYPNSPALVNVSVSVSAQQFVGIIGPNGAGKSTLLKLMAGILTPGSGRIQLQQKPLESYQRKDLAKIIGYVAQDFSTAFSFSVYQIASMGRYPYLSPFSRETKADKKFIRSAMEETDVWHLRNRDFTELSGGERQRVVLASALAQEPQLLLLDEPTAALDIKHQIRFYEILKTLQQKKVMTIITVTHDINLAARYCNRLIVLKNGQIFADDIPAQIITNNLMESVYEVPLEVMPHPKDGKPMVLLG